MDVDRSRFLPPARERVLVFVRARQGEEMTYGKLALGVGAARITTVCAMRDLVAAEKIRTIESRPGANGAVALEARIDVIPHANES